MNKVCDMTYLISVMVYLLGPFVASEYTAVVETSSGPVRGAIVSTLKGVNYASFVGIRYAEPPVGDLRFKPPVAVRPRKKTLTAIIEGDECPQLTASGAVIGVEDCLYLNVFTPVTNLREIPTALKSVMVWIHEGSFADGSGDMITKKPDFLLLKDVVFVSMNYRLGALGFLSLNHREATGNQGLKDQKLALQWVQKNIEKFGGDPQSVTIFGKDAGAASVGYHVLSDASKGLFHAAISMSGTPLAPRSFLSPKDAADRGRLLAEITYQEQWGIWLSKRYILRALRTVAIRHLLLSAYAIDPNAAFLPTVEDPTKATDVFLSDYPKRKYKSGNFNKVPQLLGITGSKSSQYDYDKEKFLALLKKTIERTRAKTGKNPEGLVRLKQLTKLYGHKSGTFYDSVVYCAKYATYDILVKAPMQETRNLLVKNIGNSDVYYYNFDLPAKGASPISENDLNLNAVTYPEDLACIFYIPYNNYNLHRSSETDRTIHSVVTMWTNFAKYGNPTPDPLARDPSGITWPTYGSSELGLRIGKQLEIVSTPTNILFDRNSYPYDELFRSSVGIRRKRMIARRSP